MTNPLSRYESVVDRQIRLAQERGEFDNLPGLGKPLPDRGDPDDELWWVKDYIRREGLSTEALLPTPLRLAREIERLPETVRKLPSEQAVREAVRDLNRRIAEHLRAPAGPHVPVRPVDSDTVVEQWRATRQRHADPPVRPPHEQSPSRPTRWWQRLFGRRRST